MNAECLGEVVHHVFDQADQGILDIFFDCVAVRELQNNSARLAIRFKLLCLMLSQGRYTGNSRLDMLKHIVRSS
jgi:hypothetical protein